MSGAVQIPESKTSGQNNLTFRAHVTLSEPFSRGLDLPFVLLSLSYGERKKGDHSHLMNQVPLSGNGCRQIKGPGEQFVSKLVVEWWNFTLCRNWWERESGQSRTKRHRQQSRQPVRQSTAVPGGGGTNCRANPGRVVQINCDPRGGVYRCTVCGVQM